MNKFISVAGGVVIGMLAAAAIIGIFGMNPITLLLGAIAFLVSTLFGSLYVGNTVNRYDQMRQLADERKITNEEFSTLQAPVGIKLDDFRQTLVEANSKVGRLIWAADKIRSRPNKNDFEQNEAEASALYRIAAKGYEIIREIKADPRDWRVARSWFNTYLDQSVNIVETNAKNEYPLPPVTEMFAGVLTDIDTNLTKVLNDIKMNDVDAMRVDMEVLRDQLAVENR